MAYYLQQRQQQHEEREYYYHHNNVNVNLNESRNPNFEFDPISNSTQPKMNTKIPIYIPKEQRHINTLFVSGLPDDVIPREIHNLFRRRPGFDSSQLKFTGRGNQVVAFVTFFNHQSAVMALQDLDGVKFDPQAGSVLHIELARSNSRRKRMPGSGPYVVIDNRKKAADDCEDTSSDDGDNDSDNRSQSEDPDSSNNKTHSATVKSDEKKVELCGAEARPNIEKTSEGDLRSCSTLFIANLGPNCSEDELRQALSQYPGFNGLKLRAKSGMPVAFADYEEVEQATNAMQALQGSMLPSSDRGGMHIEYARSKMRKP
ncbi:U2 small nuclear ribonucleoprotein B'' isoform X2 [Beta vulgaris subsp. vulgaris]|uniref:U2 small nuclear ribonucleoprotein B'' isoform X2 n=1 Tax=Beta vulgaris subsp. vulgaris TaxID=3555 RepID=UPI00053FBCA6|nr:U2 small nuclear ribonucleoprotein B'' isoform X2 [Beta vulgaris subsp. vulgaris]